MKQSLMFIPTLRDIPKDAEIPSHIILLKGGYIKQLAAGIYSYLPLAQRIIQKIEQIVREEMNRIGCSELLMPAMQPKDLWVESGRWDIYGKELVRLQDRHERDFCLGPTHEEVVTSIARDVLTTYKKYPLALYQIQTKFRDEFRPRFGLMRCREFIMKDLYTFHTSNTDLDVWYQKVRQAYINVCDRLQLHYRIVGAASGQIGGSSSEEFMVLCDNGEDLIAYSDKSDFANSYELCKLEEGAPSPDGEGMIKHAKGIEVGHVFKLGTKYSEAMNLMYVDAEGKKNPAIMGCYGMGISRLLMALLEQHNDNLRVLWPKEVAPFTIHMIPLAKENSEGFTYAYALYEKLQQKGLEILFDDRSETAGVKFNDSDLIGIRYRIIIGRRFKEDIVELKDMVTKTTEEIHIDQLLDKNFD